MRIYLDSIGCRLNWSEIESLAQQFTAAGHKVASDPEGADVIIVNTCAVTAQAERKTRHQIRSFHRDNPDARIAVIGCYPTLRPERSTEFAGVEWVVPNAEKARTVESICAEPSAIRDLQSTIHKPPLRTRAFVKVQDGCDNHCTYCIIRELRGPGRSRPLGDVVAEVRGLVEVDCQEVVLTGVNLGSYGRDLGQPDGLRALIESLLVHTDVARLRLSSLEPWDVDEPFFDLWEDPRLCRQLHLPLQAGCDATLRRMGRPITTEAFARLVKAARAAIPGLAVTTDVLVGFPGEDETAFRASYDFVERMAFAKLHVFPYSPRPGTPAVRLSDRVPQAVRDERASHMRELGATQRRRFRERFVGRTLEVLWEKQWRDGRWTGWTDNYIRVVTAAESLYNRVTKTRLSVLHHNYMEGEVIYE